MNRSGRVISLLCSHRTTAVHRVSDTTDWHTLQPNVSSAFVRCRSNTCTNTHTYIQGWCVLLIKREFEFSLISHSSIDIGGNIQGKETFPSVKIAIESIVRDGIRLFSFLYLFHELFRHLYFSSWHIEQRKNVKSRSLLHDRTSCRRFNSPFPRRLVDCTDFLKNGCSKANYLNPRRFWIQCDFVCIWRKHHCRFWV